VRARQTSLTEREIRRRAGEKNGMWFAVVRPMVSRPYRSCLALTFLALGACAVPPAGDADPEETGRVASAICLPGLPCDLPPGELAVPTVAEIGAGYTGFDINGDGVPEINSLTLMSFEPAVPEGTGVKGLAVVLVDPRLIAQFPKSLASGITTRLTTFRNDLVAEGYHTRFLLADVYRGAIHQDGRTLLALRRFLKDVRVHHPLRGVTLVGSFPEAVLYRRAFFKTSDAQGPFFVLAPTRLNQRADIVLADLDGNWESLYQQNAAMEKLSVQVPSSAGSWPLSGQFLSGTVRQLETVQAEDTFYIQDDYVTRMTASVVGGPVTVYIQSTAQRNPELTASDRTQPNPMARPEITVSRLNTKGIAVNPILPPDLLGRLPLDDSTSKPQAVEHDTDVSISWEHDPILEQRILIDYFDRNHAFRLGSDRFLPYRTAALRGFNNNGHTAPATSNLVLVQADPVNFSPSIAVDTADKVEFVDWLKTTATLRGLEAGTNETHVSVQPASHAAVEAAIGGRPWRWKKQVNATTGHTHHTPTVDSTFTTQWEFGRTLWENHMLAAAGQTFYVHGGRKPTATSCCQTNISYDDALYSQRNNAEALVFFDNGLAEYARGSDADFPLTNVGQSIRINEGRFGYAWVPAFLIDSLTSSLKPGTNGDARVLSNKRSYDWTVLGDWTLKIRY
jgi:hypothetical protein